MGALGGCLEFARDSAALLGFGAAIPLRSNRMGRHILSVVDFGKDASRSACGPVAAASLF